MALATDSPNVFATHVLHGRRFEEHAVPVDVLSELGAYRSLVIAVARGVFFQENRARQRVPKNFADGFQLTLSTIGEGSAVLALERVGTAEEESQLSFQSIDYFDRARDLVLQVVRDTALGKPIPDDFPRSALPYFNQFGRSLLDDENIELRVRHQTPAVYTRQVRKQLVLIAAQTYEDSVDVVGHVVQFDRQRMVFDILLDGRRVSGRLDELSEDTVRKISTACAHGDQLLVRISGLGAYDGEDQLIRFVKVEDVNYAEDEALRAQLDVDKQLEALADLPEGWYDGDGAMLDREGLQWVAGVLKRAEALGLRRPYLYPMPDGRLQAEWSHPEAEVSAEIDVVSFVAELSGVVVRSRAARDKRIDLATDAGIDELVDFVTVFGPDGMSAPA